MNINEYKGNLFEFLVGLSLSCQTSQKNELLYLQNIDSKLLTCLQEYQHSLFRDDPTLYRKLLPLAKQTAAYLKEHILSPGELEQIPSLVGKITGASHDDIYQEADLLLASRRISLKLCKMNSFVNTKNAGVQSFIAKYFPYPEAFERQQELNQCLDFAHAKLMSLMKSHSITDSLPGELPVELRHEIFSFYSEIIAKIYHILQSFYRQDPAFFIPCLYPLFGFGHPDVLQVKCFHQDHDLQGIQVLDFQSLVRDAASCFEFGELKSGISSFEMRIKGIRLQIRVKPMNKITVKSPKVNCSVHFCK